MFNFVQHRNRYFLFSSILILISIIAIAVSIATYPEHSPVRLSMDFTGGSLFEVQFQPIRDTQPSGLVTEPLLHGVYSQFSPTDVRVQRLGSVDHNRWQIRTGFMDEVATQDLRIVLNDTVAPLGLQVDPATLRFSQVSPTIGSESGYAAVGAVAVASIVITGFIVFTFRQVADSFRYGLCAILAMLHDIVILVGTMSILGFVFGWEADALFLTAVLTVVAYSVQDSIVVFDRIRENIVRHRGEPYEMIVNRSILETVQRSITTQLLIGFVLVSLILIGGETMRPFVTILLIGLISGTYSSLFVGIPLLVAWEHRELPLIHRSVLSKA